MQGGRIWSSLPKASTTPRRARRLSNVPPPPSRSSGRSPKWFCGIISTSRRVSVADAESIVAQDGYVRGSSRPEDVTPVVENSVRVVFERVQVLDALHCSQERSRMAGLAQRLGGSVAGWDALQPPILAEAPPKRGRRKS